MKNVTYINAGAGSGKTHTLTELLSGVLKSGKARPDEVVLTTFTVKAANDFKNKSKATLFEQGLFDEANMLDAALIGTIHGVAYSIISKFWYYLGLPPKPRIMTEDDGNVYRSQSLGSLPTKEELEQLHRFADSFEIKDVNQAVDYNFWQAHLNAMIGFTTNYEITDYARSRERSKAFYREFVDTDAPALPTEEEVRRALKALKDIFDTQKETATNNNRKEKVKELERRINEAGFGFYKDLLRLGTSIGVVKENPDVALVNDKLYSMWQSKEVCAVVESYIDIMFDLAERWRKQYEIFKKTRKILDFNDLEKYLLQLLHTPFFAQQIGAQYRYVFVDEYQDCSPIQIKIFMALSDLAEHSYWVGDMKQSIFGFRGSDTQLADAVVKSIDLNTAAGCDSRTLGYSWRSVPDIVDFCNRIFVPAFAPDIPEERVRLSPQKEADANISPLVLWNVDDDEMLVKLIAQLVSDGAKPSEIAVLNRRGAPLRELGKQLAVYNIPVNLSTEPIMTSRAALLAKAILNVVDNDADTLAKGEIAFLLDSRYHTENLISETLRNVNPETGRPDHYFLDEIPVLQRLMRNRDRFKQQSVAELVETVFLELNLFEEAKKCCNEKEAVNVLNTIIDVSKTYEEVALRLDTIPTIKGFVDYLDSGAVMLPGDPAGVELLTMHKSKGLEWKYVIITSLASNPANVKTIMKREVFGVHFRRISEPTSENLFPEVYITLLPFVYGSGNADVPAPLNGIISNKPKFVRICKEKISEETRLMYVAMTRPTHQLILSLEKKNPLRWLTDMGLKEISDDVSLIKSYGFEVKGLEWEIQPKALDTVKKTYVVDFFDGLPDKRDYLPSMIEGVASVVESEDFGKRISLGELPRDVDMNFVGTCVHHIFQLCDCHFPDNAKVKAIIDSYGLSTVLWDYDGMKESWHRLIDFVVRKHGNIIAYSHERPFSLHRGGKIFTGSIDLSIDTQEGCIFVDYKTCPMNDSAILDKDNAHYVGLYGGQLNCYRQALESVGIKVVAAYVYYPISGIIVRLGDMCANG